MLRHLTFAPFFIGIGGAERKALVSMPSILQSERISPRERRGYPRHNHSSKTLYFVNFEYGSIEQKEIFGESVICVH